MTVVPAETARIALDQTACIYSQSNIGETIVHNICDGTSTVVPWGSADWLAILGLTGLFVFFGLMILSIVVLMARSIWEGF